MEKLVINPTEKASLAKLIAEDPETFAEQYLMLQMKINRLFDQLDEIHGGALSKQLKEMEQHKEATNAKDTD